MSFLSKKSSGLIWPLTSLRKEEKFSLDFSIFCCLSLREGFFIFDLGKSSSKSLLLMKLK